MPELPEVETVRRGLLPLLVGARIVSVALNRADLRFPFPEGLAEALTGRQVEAIERRAKYLLFRLSGGLTWLSHLGMTGSFGFAERPAAPETRYFPAPEGAQHQHVVIGLIDRQEQALTLIYTDARRFGFMDVFEDEADCPYLRDLGLEPLSNGFNAQSLAEALRGKRAPIKAALLDQTIIAGLGNIYVSEALYRAHIRPDSAAGTLVEGDGEPTGRLEALVSSIRAVLLEAIEAGGSTLRDFRAADGGSGYFQHRFAVYDKEGEACPTPQCSGQIERLVQSGRSSFFCPVCQLP